MIHMLAFLIASFQIFQIMVENDWW